jgi:hypothetical protein
MRPDRLDWGTTVENTTGLTTRVAVIGDLPVGDVRALPKRACGKRRSRAACGGLLRMVAPKIDFTFVAVST